MRVTIRKIGDSSAVVLPRTLLAELRVGEGDELAIAVVEGRIVLAPLGQEARAACALAAQTVEPPTHDALAWPEPTHNEDESLDDRVIRRV
jgi:antitoxin component of MazEF toxin-antitoxin module